MKRNRLQAFKQILRKSSVITLVISLLVTSYSFTLNNSTIYAQLFEPDCRPPSGTGTQIEGIVPAGFGKIDGTVAGSFLRVKNCGNNNHTVSADIYAASCTEQTGNCFPKKIRTDGAITLRPGEYYTFQERGPSITCGAAQTDIHPYTDTQATGFPTHGVYQTVGTSCNQPSPSPTQNVCTIQGYKILMPSGQPVSPATEQTVSLDRSIYTAANPYTFNNVSSGNHTVAATSIAGYDTAYTLCYNNINCHTGATTKAESVVVNCPAGGYADLWWHYIPQATPTPTITPSPTPTATPPQASDAPLPTPTPTLAPAPLSANAVCTATNNTAVVTANWSAVTGATSYTVSLQDPTGVTLAYKNAGNTTQTTFTNNDVASGVQSSKQYRVAVSANNSVGQGTATFSTYTTCPAVSTPTPVITASPTPTITPSPTPTPTPTITSSPTPTLSPTIAPTVTPTITPSPSPISTTQLKICKYEDDNGDGIVNGQDNIISWTFNYKNATENKAVDSHWWHFWNQGCAIVDVPVGQNITVSEVQKPGWRQTGLYADGARTDTNEYTYTSNIDAVKVMWFLNTFTPNTTPTPSATPTATPSITPTPTLTASPTVSATASPTPTATITPSPIPTASVTPTPSTSPTASPSISPTASPAAGTTTELKVCKYNDTNADGNISSGDNTIEWNFNYQIDGVTTTVHRTWWDVVWHQGCVIVDVPINKSVNVTEETRSDWRQTALYADGAKAESSNYTYTSANDAVKVLWFLNTQNQTTSSPTPTATPTSTPSPTVTPSPTATTVPVVNSSYNITIEKRVDGTRIEGDKVGIQYRVKVKNTGTNRIDGLEVRDTLPPDFIYDQNTTEGDITANPEIQDVSGDDNRRLVWKNIGIDAGKEINFGYRTTGKRENKNYCNDAQVRKDDNIIATSQACVTINQPSGQVLGVSTTRVLPATGTNPIFFMGIGLMIISLLGWKMSRHIE